MKKLHFIPALLLLTFTLSAQSSAKKYVLLEHFTNSKCSNCAGKNPAFYSLISQPQYADDVHHIAIHPPYPYVDCVFYQANKDDNGAWAAFYNILGTPRVAVNGNLIPSSSQILRQDTLNKYIDKTSPLYLKVTETGSGSNPRTAKIEAFALSQIPAGNYKLYVVLAEKVINQTTANGESVHHDVFRDALTPIDGQVFTPPAAGQSVEFNFNYNITGSWNASQIYVLAYVKETNSKQVLNSGTKFDPLTVSASEPTTNTVRFSPNPAGNTTFAEIGDDVALRTDVYAANGKLVYSGTEAQEKTVALSTTTFAPGLYFVKITGKKGIYTAKMVKE